MDSTVPEQVFPQSPSSDGDNHATAASNDANSRATSKPLLDIGWIVAGNLEDPDLQATTMAREAALAWLQAEFPEFAWKMQLVRREEFAHRQQVESIELLDFAVTERNLRGWDYSLVITPADLISHYKHEAWSVVSRSMQAAVIATARIDPRAYDASVDTSVRIKLMMLRMRALVIHLIGHLAGLEHDGTPHSFMSALETMEALDDANSLTATQAAAMRAGLWQVADRRLEEQADTWRWGSLRFYLRATWINRRQISSAVLRAKFWQFPLRLSRLTTAAASAVLVQIITAEAWELGLNQPAKHIAALSTLAIVLTTVYVVTHQRLLVQRGQQRLSEVTVVTNVSTLAIVLLGLATTFGLLAVTTFVFAHVLFQPALVANWASSVNHTIHTSDYAKLATFVASIGISISALGASFEQQQYFRHITHVDEEI